MGRFSTNKKKNKKNANAKMIRMVYFFLIIGGVRSNFWADSLIV